MGGWLQVINKHLPGLWWARPRLIQLHRKRCSPVAKTLSDPIQGRMARRGVLEIYSLHVERCCPQSDPDEEGQLPRAPASRVRRLAAYQAYVRYSPRTTRWNDPGKNHSRHSSSRLVASQPMCDRIFPVHGKAKRGKNPVAPLTPPVQYSRIPRH